MSSLATIFASCALLAGGSTAYAEPDPDSDDIDTSIESLDGEVSEEAIGEVLESRRGELEFCYGKAIEKQGVGQVDLQKTVFADSKGRVFAVEPPPPEREGFTFRECVHFRMLRWEFPETKNGGISKMSFRLSFGREFAAVQKEASDRESREPQLTEEEKARRARLAEKAKQNTVLNDIGRLSSRNEQRTLVETLEASGEQPQPEPYSSAKSFKRAFGPPHWTSPPLTPHFTVVAVKVPENLDRDLPSANVRRFRTQIDECYVESLLDDDSVEGELKFVIYIGEDGEPERVSTESEMPDELGSCIEDVMAPEKLRHIEADAGESATVYLEFRRSAF
jgi:hypothetical protein